MASVYARDIEESKLTDAFFGKDLFKKWDIDEEIIEEEIKKLKEKRNKIIGEKLK